MNLHFARIRYYGLLSATKREQLRLLQKEFGIHTPKKREKKDWKQICREHLSYDPDLCPHCKQGKMINIERFDPGRGPPLNLYNQQAATGK